MTHQHNVDDRAIAVAGGPTAVAAALATYEAAYVAYTAARADYVAALDTVARRGGYTDAEIAAGNGPRGGAPRGADRERK